MLQRQALVIGWVAFVTFACTAGVSPAGPTDSQGPPLLDAAEAGGQDVQVDDGLDAPPASEVAAEATLTRADAAVAPDGLTPTTDTGLGDASAAATDASATVDAAADVKPDTAGPAPSTQGGPVPVKVGGAIDPGTQWLAWTAPGQPVHLVFGPQGGYHVWVSVCVPANAGTPLPVKVALTDTATGLPVPPGPLKLKTKLVPDPDNPGQLCRLAMPAFVDCACEMANRAVRVRVEVDTGSTDLPLVSWAEHSVAPQHVQGPCLPPLLACAPFL
ncbi:MAG: hypothetical protein FJ100_04900 [Deltaproteobacteria bacterium]|nr:hypothetical protein [Deltaproteobacteria bacterium]